MQRFSIAVVFSAMLNVVASTECGDVINGNGNVVDDVGCWEDGFVLVQYACFNIEEDEDTEEEYKDWAEEDRCVRMARTPPEEQLCNPNTKEITLRSQNRTQTLSSRSKISGCSFLKLILLRHHLSIRSIWPKSRSQPQRSTSKRRRERLTSIKL